MKKMILFLFLVTAGSAFARLGLSDRECAQEYGMPKTIIKDHRTYQFGPYQVETVMKRNEFLQVVDKISYSKKPEQIDESEIDTLLTTNAFSYSWISNTAFDPTEWERSDGAMARLSEDKTTLVFLSKEHVALLMSQQPVKADPKKTFSKKINDFFKKHAKKKYINISYYDLREEESMLYENSGLDDNATSVKKITVMKQINVDFRDKYVGKYVKWGGGFISDITERYGQFICSVEMDKDTFYPGADISFAVSQEVAMDAEKYKEIIIDGKIERLAGNLHVDMSDVTFSYVNRGVDYYTPNRPVYNNNDNNSSYRPDPIQTSPAKYPIPYPRQWFSEKEQEEAEIYMHHVTDISVKKIAEREQPTNFCLQKFTYDVQLDAKHYIFEKADSPERRQAREEYPNDFFSQRKKYDLLMMKK